MAITDLHDICCSSSDTNTIGQRGTTLNLQILGQCEHINFFWAIIMFILLTWHFFNNYWGFRFRPWCCAINYLNPIIIFLGKVSQFFGLGKRKVSTVILQQQNSMCCVPFCYRLHSKSDIFNRTKYLFAKGGVRGTQMYY